MRICTSLRAGDERIFFKKGSYLIILNAVEPCKFGARLHTMAVPNKPKAKNELTFFVSTFVVAGYWYSR